MLYFSLISRTGVGFFLLAVDDSDQKLVDEERPAQGEVDEGLSAVALKNSCSRWCITSLWSLPVVTPVGEHNGGVLLRLSEVPLI